MRPDDEIMLTKEESDSLLRGSVYGIIGGLICWAVIIWLILTS